MSYLVLARKYRPQTFDEVVKQDHVTRTLTNAIVSDRVAHAILFSGPRGTGKTTIARILAKAMNCKEGPAPVPCNQCRSCQEITSGSAADVFEIDGASNNGVDQIRELRENVKYLPAHSPHKIYIIDEVHMLSVQAFNALLKTLEEPPAHVMFLFATTEPHKIPITILSRCQRHDLRRIDIESVSDHMLSLCQQEGIDIDKKTLGLIAREAGGSMRDALSLLDQVMTCAEGAITHEQVLDILGVVDRAVLFDISGAILKGNVPEILDIVDEIYNHGHNIKEFYSEVIEHFRNLLIVRMGKKVGKLVDLPAHETAHMAEQVKNVSELWLSQLLDILFKEESAIRFSSQPKLALEMAFIRMFQAKPVLPIDTLIQKLDNLTKGIYENPAIYTETLVQEQRESVQDKGSVRAIRTPESPVTHSSISSETIPSISSETIPGNPGTIPQAESEETIPEEPRITFDPDDPPDRTWEKLVDIISEKYPSVGANLTRCALKELTDQRLEIEINGNGFHVSRINKNKANIESICNDFFGKNMKLVINAKEISQDDRQQKKTEADRLRQEALDHPLVGAVVEIFGGRVTDVKILQ